MYVGTYLYAKHDKFFDGKRLDLIIIIINN